MLLDIFFLSSLFPLTQELFQNPHLNNLFQTLNLTHTLLNASKPQLAKDCWICLFVIPLWDSSFPTSILNWTTGKMSLHHSYFGEPLFVSYLKYLHTSDQIQNLDKLLGSLLTDLPSYNGKPPVGGPITQKVTLLQPAPFCVSAAAKSLQSCPTLCDPIDSSPPGSPIPGILQARTLKWVAISFSNAQKWKVKLKSLSRVRLLATPWTTAYQAPPSLRFFRHEYWSGLPFPSPMHSSVRLPVELT